ncbi:serine/arginine repetitive matrix protein 1-like isoform X2 [Neovison vison]|nr:serine/arginine repetitive matrix protein 1-like isoform X2 [Neogale vison]
MLISSHRLMQKEPWTRNKEQSSEIRGSPEAASDTWPGRESHLQTGNFWALVRWRAELTWASDEGSANLCGPRVSGGLGLISGETGDERLSPRPPDRSPWRAGRSRAASPRPPQSTGPRHIREPETTPSQPPGTQEQAAPKSSVPPRRRRKNRPRRGILGTAATLPNRRQPCTKRVPPPGRRRRIPSPLPYPPRPAPSRLRPAPRRSGVEAPDWSRGWTQPLIGRDGVTRAPSSAFQRRLLGRLSLSPQSRALASSRVYVLLDPLYQRPPSTSLGLSRLLCATRPPHTLPA